MIPIINSAIICKQHSPLDYDAHLFALLLVQTLYSAFKQKHIVKFYYFIIFFCHHCSQKVVFIIGLLYLIALNCTIAKDIVHIRVHTTNRTHINKLLLYANKTVGK